MDLPNSAQVDRVSSRAGEGGLASILIVGFFAHIVIAAVGILVIPIYLHLMGPEAYGLVGFYTALQGWMLLFDFGLSPAVARQLSRFRAGALEAEGTASLLRIAETVFLVAGLGGLVWFILAEGWVAHHWLGPSKLPSSELADSLASSVACWYFGGWQGCTKPRLSDFERQRAVNLVALVGTIGRAAGSLIALRLSPGSPVGFFAVQAGMTLAEAVANRLILYRAMPRTPRRWLLGLRLLSAETRFAAGIALSSAVGTMINQADKLTLSHTMRLADFGIFSLVVSICTGIAMVVPPFVQAFQPRLTALLAQGHRAEFAHIHRLSISLGLVLAFGLAGTIAAQPELVLLAWTGRRDLSIQLAPILSLYAVGAGVSAFLSVPAVLQYALGYIRLHVIGYLVFGAITIPAVVWAAYAYGPLGTGVVWTTGNILFALLWTPFVYRRLLSLEERRGIERGIAYRAVILGAALSMTRWLHADSFNRLGALGFLAMLCGVVMAIGVLASPDLRRSAITMMHRLGPEAQLN